MSINEIRRSQLIFIFVHHCVQFILLLLDLLKCHPRHVCLTLAKVYLPNNCPLPLVSEVLHFAPSAALKRAYQYLDLVYLVQVRFRYRPRRH
jgi:hypothetical protein